MTFPLVTLNSAVVPGLRPGGQKADAACHSHWKMQPCHHCARWCIATRATLLPPRSWALLYAPQLHGCWGQSRHALSALQRSRCQPQLNRAPHLQPYATAGGQSSTNLSAAALTVPISPASTASHPPHSATGCRNEQAAAVAARAGFGAVNASPQPVLQRHTPVHLPPNTVTRRLSKHRSKR